MLHDLKILPEYFSEVVEGNKKFEVRKNDRGYRTGDVLVLREWDSLKEEYTGEVFWCKVTYILKDSPYLQDGFVVLGISHLNDVGQLTTLRFDSWSEFIKAFGTTMIREQKLFDAVMNTLGATSKAAAYTESATIHHRLRTVIKEAYGGDIFETERKEK
ncbi:ASCH/PUA domain-containing protein [Paenibacillus alvei]|uniref:ASCH/PUA domain-containing protein n=1 Tax=Paenibacillus alvei TaxID=44250 RepID=UPI000288AE23|nr:ASCH/PUA domain-containing protein [Paenibacillus alvei]EJW20042.1 hypothetical protein PAV_1c10380 [Paenibacillus alvei DSM 29]